jgi:nucleoside-triphosphatase THEP1
VFIFGGKPLTQGREKKPLKLFIYGRNGIGKTTFACQFDKPVLLDLEDNASHIESDRFFLSSYKEVKSFLYELKIQKHDFKTVILDSLDMLQALIIEDILARHQVKTLAEVGGFGAAYGELKSEFGNILKRMDALFQHGMNIIFTGHETISRIEEPGEKVYDRVTPAIREPNYSQICNWCFGVFYATSRVRREAEENLGFNQKRKGNVSRVSTRVFYTEPSAAHLAKNIFKLSNPLDIDYPLFKQEIENFYNPSPNKEEE